LHQPDKKLVSAQNVPLLGLLLCSALGACEPEAVEQAAPPPVRSDSGCGENGRLQTALFGGLEATVNWPGSRMQCESMQRPNREGIRMRFTGDVSGERLAIIIAVPDMQAGEPAAELRSNVTVTVEGSGRFYNTPNLDSCWTDVSSQSAVPGARGSYVISGTLYCVSPLGQVNGDAAVSIPELSFSTVVKWDVSTGVPSLDGAFGRGTLTIESDDGVQHTLDIYVATDVDQQRRGLMFVRNMPENTGMLFVYDDSEMHSMWMKNTYIPLDMVFARGDGTVSSVIHDTQPLSLSSQGSTEPVNYVLELNAGTARRLNIGRKSHISWEPVND
jgi:uncharacterized membrane protein (UPF0127 family)